MTPATSGGFYYPPRCFGTEARTPTRRVGVLLLRNRKEASDVARRDYTDHEKANALALLSIARVEDVAKQTGIPARTLRAWKANPPKGAAELSHEKEASLADELRHAARALVGAIPGKIAEAPLNHTAIALGIIFDKLQLLEGRPTSIDEVRDALSDDDRAARVAALLDRARARRAGMAN